MVWIIEDLATALDTFGSVAGTDPVAAALLFVAVAILAATFGVTGILVLGALSNLAVGWP